MKLLKLGVQVSIAGKIYKSLTRARELGCNTMQIFSRNPRQRRKEFLTSEDAETFRELVKKEKISPVIIHTPYLLNLASTKHSFHKITIREFAIDLKEADKLAADYFITHMGSFKGGTENGGLLRIVYALNKIFKKTEGIKTEVLLENTSGSGQWLGYKFSHQRFVLERVSCPQRLGLCLDTAHAWAAGYKINDKNGLNSLLDEIDEEVGLVNLKVIHLNDTQENLGSRCDRHYAIGRGKIGKKGFKLILNHPKLRNIPFILETPKESQDDDIKNLSIVRKLYQDELHKRNR